MSPEEAAELSAKQDLKVYQQNQREIDICCDVMRKVMEDPDTDSRFWIRVNNLHPENEPTVGIPGMVPAVKFCPFCAAPVVIKPWVDKEDKTGVIEL
jgi:hypothetical protein